MPPRVFIPIRRRRRPSVVQEVDPILTRMTHGSLLIALGFVIILAGVLVLIFALNPKNPNHYRPASVVMRRRPDGYAPRARTVGPRTDTRESADTGPGVSATLIFGPFLVVGGIVVCICGAILYGTNYRKGKRKEKEAKAQSLQGESHQDVSSSTGNSPGGGCLTTSGRQDDLRAASAPSGDSDHQDNSPL